MWFYLYNLFVIIVYNPVYLSTSSTAKKFMSRFLTLFPSYPPVIYYLSTALISKIIWFISAAKKGSVSIFSFTKSRAWTTVLWSRLNSRPISGRDKSVSSVVKNMAIWRGHAIDWVLRLELKSSIFILKCLPTIFLMVLTLIDKSLSLTKISASSSLAIEIVGVTLCIPQ